MISSEESIPPVDVSLVESLQDVNMHVKSRTAASDDFDKGPGRIVPHRSREFFPPTELRIGDCTKIPSRESKINPVPKKDRPDACTSCCYQCLFMPPGTAKCVECVSRSRNSSGSCVEMMSHTLILLFFHISVSYGCRRRGSSGMSKRTSRTS